MQAARSPSELDAAQALLRLSPSSNNNLGGIDIQPRLRGPSMPKTRPRGPVEEPLRGPRALKASLVQPDVQSFEQRLADERRIQGLQQPFAVQGDETSFYKILRYLRYLVAEYATEIKQCNRPGLDEFFVKADCLRAQFGWREKRTPRASLWTDHLKTIYTDEELRELTLWAMIEDFLYMEEQQLESLQEEMADTIPEFEKDKAAAFREFKLLQVVQNSIEMGPRETLYLLRCAWRWYVVQAPASAARLKCAVAV
jgi:hypothetical protein